MINDIDTIKKAYKAQHELIDYYETIIKAKDITLNKNIHDIDNLKAVIIDLKNSKGDMIEKIEKANEAAKDAEFKFKELSDILDENDISTINKRDDDGNRIIAINLSNYKHKRRMRDGVKTVLFGITVILLIGIVYYVSR